MLGSGLKRELTVLEKIVIVCERSREDKSNEERESDSMSERKSQREGAREESYRKTGRGRVEKWMWQ